MQLDFSRCRRVWIADDSEAGGFWSPPPPHVEEGVKAIVQNPYFFIATEMGGMKTAQAIIAAQFLHEASVIDRVIVIAPSSVRPVWYDRDLGQLAEQLWDDRRALITEFHSTVRKWIHQPDKTNELRWVISNYEFIRRTDNLKILLPYCGPKTLLILDESSAVKGDSAQTEACMKLRWQTNRKGHICLGIPRAGRILLLNGTPIADSPMDLFTQGNLLHPSILGCRYVTHFKARYAIMAPVLGPGGTALTTPHGKAIEKITGWTNLPDLQQRFAPYVLRREAKDIGIDFALPPVPLAVPLTSTTWRIYCEMRDEMVAYLQNGDIAVTQFAATKVMRLAQITSGFIGGVETEEGVPGETQFIGREKLDFALEWHAEMLQRYPDLKLLSWCRFVPELRRYLGEVQKAHPGLPVGAVCGQPILGGRKEDERAEALRLLHPKTAPAGAAVVGGTYGTGAMGQNFTACRTVLDISWDFSSWKKRQGDARVNRPGQTGPVSFFYIIAVGPKGQKTIDHHTMMHRLGKMDLADLTAKAWVQVLKDE